LRLKYVAVVSTALVIAFGVSIVIPFFLPNSLPNSESKPKIILTFNALDTNHINEWCYNISRILEEQNIDATVFFVGRVAEENPECVSCFGNNVDVGSMTYSYSNLSSISDYSQQLEEVKRGKQAVDEAGGLYSRLFRALFEGVDDNIYSLLSRSDILADFSYLNHFNVYEEDKFIRYEAVVYIGSNYSSNFMPNVINWTENIIVSFDSTVPTVYIEEFVLNLKKREIVFLSASEATGYNLTITGD
jgi:peptidoglycan/xylan/chitin deacetylase (PgdA/CDA1 family)